MNPFELIKQDIITKEDASGQKIDLGIIDLVTALNCLGFETNSSCEGHLNDTGLFFPWVIIINDDSNIDYKDYNQVENFNNINLKNKTKLISLLAEFYKNRTTDYEHRLITGIIPGCGTELMPMSGYANSITTDNLIRQKIYKIYTNEINDFTEFLKAKI